MNRMKPIAGVIAVVGALAAFSFFRGGGVAPKPEVFASSTDLATALKASGASGKPVLALVTADWCGPCQSLKRGALVDAKVAALIKEKTEPVYIDATGANKDAAQLNVTGVPALVLLQADKAGQRELSRLVGNQSSADILEWLGNAK